ncbi:MAG: hypothetical protein JW924_01780 [Fusobacteriaceae bacterium]|nr:hypothetical protein [Fusobacteriaceae bacterium]
MRFLSLLKYEIKNRWVPLLVLTIIFVLVNFYKIGMIDLSTFESNNFEVAAAFLVMGGTITLIPIVLVVLNIKKYDEIFNSKPGYMLFLTNIPKIQILISKLIVEILEVCFFFSLIIMEILFIILKNDQTSELKYSLETLRWEDFSGLLTSLLTYLVILAVFKLAITLRRLIFGKKRLAGILTFIIFIMLVTIFDKVIVQNFVHIFEGKGVLIIILLLTNLCTWLLLEKKIDIN